MKKILIFLSCSIFLIFVALAIKENRKPKISSINKINKTVQLRYGGKTSIFDYETGKKIKLDKYFVTVYENRAEIIDSNGKVIDFLNV